jgi:peptide/nickel transport system permease protein
MRVHRRHDHSIAGLLGLALIAIVVLIGVIGPVLSPYSPDAIDLPHRLSPPGALHWFGTDELGRDLFSRIAHGAPLSLFAAVSVVGSCVLIGGAIGATGAVTPAWFDGVLMRGMDVLLSIPALVFAMALAAALGPGLINALIALLVTRLPAYVRLARNQAIVLRRQGYVEAARLYAGSNVYLLSRHILPNILPIMVVQGMSDVGGVILASAALGFIGLGAQPPTPEWGALVASGRLFFLDCWWYAAFPGLAILFATTGFNLIGDAVRDRMDPRRRDARETAT